MNSKKAKSQKGKKAKNKLVLILLLQFICTSSETVVILRNESDVITAISKILAIACLTLIFICKEVDKHR